MIRVSITLLAALTLAILAMLYGHTAQAHCPQPVSLGAWEARHDTIFVGEAVSVRPVWTAYRPITATIGNVLPYYLHGRLRVFDRAYIVEFKVSQVLKGKPQETVYYKLIDRDIHEIDKEEGIIIQHQTFGGRRIIKLFTEGTEYVVFANNGWVRPGWVCNPPFTPSSYASYYDWNVEWMPSIRETVPTLDDGVAPTPGSVARKPDVPLPHEVSAMKMMHGDTSSYYNPSTNYLGDTYGELAVARDCCTDEELKRLWLGMPISTATSPRYYEEAGMYREYWR